MLVNFIVTIAVTDIIDDSQLFTLSVLRTFGELIGDADWHQKH